MPLPAPVTMATRFIQASRKRNGGALSCRPAVPSLPVPSELDRKVQQVGDAKHVVAAVVGEILRVVVGREPATLVGQVGSPQPDAVSASPNMLSADIQDALGRHARPA